MTGLAATFTVTNNLDSGPGSLRQALLDANGSAGPDIVAFAIPGGGIQIIGLRSDLPEVSETITVDGTTQPEYAGTPRVEIISGRAGRNYQGLRVGAGAPGSIVRGVALRPGMNAVSLAVSNCRVEACYFGLNAVGDTGVFTFGAGIEVTSGGNLIANNRFGVAPLTLTGAGATGNRIEGNRFGLNAAGTANLDGFPLGISLTDAPNNFIGGPTEAQRNLIAAQVELNGAGATGNRIEGNWLGGFRADGTALDGGPSPGIKLSEAPGNWIGGLAAGAGNVISGCRFGDGVLITGAGATGNRVVGNLIGLNPAGTLAHPNNAGVRINAGASGNVVGGTEAGARNVISGNRTVGVALNSASDNRVQGNFIGTDRAGLVAVPNGQPGGLYGSGVDVGANVGPGQTPTVGNLIGGAAAGEGNVISGNANLGVQLFGLLTVSNRVQGNVIGATADRIGPLGNGTGNQFPGSGGAGVQVGAAGIEGNLIGGPPGSGAGNLIGWNGQGANFHAGVISFGTNTLVEGNTIVSNKGPGVAFTAPTRVQANLFLGNTGIDIDRGADGPTPNVPGSPYNSPKLVNVSAGSVVVEGELANKPNCCYRVEVTVYGDAPDFPATVVEEGCVNEVRGTSFTIVVPGAFEKARSVSATATVIDCAIPETSESSNVTLRQACPDSVHWNIEELPPAIAGQPYPGFQFSTTPPAIDIFAATPDGLPVGMTESGAAEFLGGVLTGIGTYVFQVTAILPPRCSYTRTYQLEVIDPHEEFTLHAEVAGQELVITYRDISVPVVLEATPSLSPVDWSPIAEGANGRIAVSLDALGSQKFLRLTTR